MDDHESLTAVSIEHDQDQDNTNVKSKHNGRNTVRNRTIPQNQTTDQSRTSPVMFEDGCVVIPNNTNDVEAHRIVNNYHFGFKKWKSHVTDRPLYNRSEIVQDLYTDINKLQPVQVSTIRPFNIIYVVLFGWWVALIYLIVAFLMSLTVIGWPYTTFCWMMAKYYLWPFGKFVHRIHQKSSLSITMSSAKERCGSDFQLRSDESSSLLGPTRQQSVKKYWTSPRTYLWIVLGTPLLLLVHGIVMAICWLLVVTIPIAKVNLKAVVNVLFNPPDEIEVGDSSLIMLDSQYRRSEIIMYTHQAVNVYYYKYTVDGMNVILVNLLVFVILSLAVGYADRENKYTSGLVKCILSTMAVIPLTYYIGMGIISVSAQSSYAVGAVLNATFGSMVELILYIVALNKGMGPNENANCYIELVKSAITGTIVGSMLFIPGLCMVVGGIKYRSQKFNPKSASVTALLLFVAVGGVFAPSIFAKIYGDLVCRNCENITFTHNSTENGSIISNSTHGFQCSQCKQSIIGLDGDMSLYNKHIEPLVYTCMAILPLVYFLGLIFSLKTHTSHVYDEFYKQMEDENEQHHSGHSHGTASWSRSKSIFILLISAVLIALCADIITENMQEFLQASGISEYFIGVTMIAMIPELPEVVNGVQFALQNNVNLGIEIGTNTSIQVCLLQVPILVLINLIYPFGFILIFNDVHLWVVILSVIVVNYTFQDGKSDYFQGFALCALYLLLMCMYFFTPTPEDVKC